MDIANRTKNIRNMSRLTRGRVSRVKEPQYITIPNDELIKKRCVPKLTQFQSKDSPKKIIIITPSDGYFGLRVRVWKKIFLVSSHLKP